VLHGGYTDEVGRHAKGAWTRLPAGAVHHPRMDEGCTLYVKRAGLPLLRSDGLD
jgi:hypothetical protein